MGSEMCIRDRSQRSGLGHRGDGDVGDADRNASTIHGLGRCKSDVGSRGEDISENIDNLISSKITVVNDEWIECPNGDC